MANKTTITVYEPTLEKFRKVHRVMRDNPSDAYDRTVDDLCDLYVDAVVAQRDASAEVTG